MADDMDIDMDIDLSLGPEVYMHEQAQPELNELNATLQQHSVTLPEDPITSQDFEPQPEKVHVRGLDDVSSNDVKQYVQEHFSLDDFVRIEWIDDTSANLIFNTAEASQEALAAFTDAVLLNLAPESIAPAQLRPAKRSSSQPNVELFVRQSTSVDVKRKGAHEASRYYLMNPDQDPRERRRAEEPRRPRRRGSDEGDYNRRRFDDREHKRRREEEGGFDASMYDDDAGDDNSSSRRKRSRHGDDLFGAGSRRANGRLRNRSASPSFDGDGRLGFGTDDAPLQRRAARVRSISPRRSNGTRNAGKELFASSTSHSSALAANNTSKELFPSKTTETKDLFPSKAESGSRELFPGKRDSLGKSFRNHRRTNAFDTSGSDAGEYFASASSPPPRDDSIGGRPATADASEMRIRGTEDKGYSIRGAAQQAQSVKELFPMKSGSNVGKELFGEKIKGRGAPRRKAEDMFY